MKIQKLTGIIVLFFALVLPLAAQQKFALVIGNSTYTSITSLKNSTNDANDMKTALESLGFQVEILINGTLEQMENVVDQFKNKLRRSPDVYGFFFYAGHGVQSNGENYLIPVNANIPGDSYLRLRALSVQVILDEIAQAGNELNIIVLDACRDNPFSWNRSGSRGLQVINRKPAGSIIMYATAAGAAAADGTGRNGLFTSHLLTHLKTPDLEVTEIFRRTGKAVAQASKGMQMPELAIQFYGNAYIGKRSVPQSSGDALTFFNRGEERRKKGEYDRAIADYTEALRLNPAYVDAYNYRGNAYYDKNDYDQAIADYTEALRIDSNYVKAYYNRGNGYYMKNDYDRAIADYTEALRIDPNHVNAKKFLEFARQRR